jgi:polar amino acid transport system substrate-binding protein
MIGFKPVFFIALFLAVSSIALYPADKLIFSRVEGHALNIAGLVLQEAYQKLNIRIGTQIYPGERSLLIANQGDKVDGEVMRIAGLEKNYPNLIQISVPVYTGNAVAYVKNKSIAVSGWESLRPYRIGIIIGHKYAENGTAGMNVEAVKDGLINFSKLDAGKIDVAVDSHLDGLLFIRELKLKDITMLQPPLQTIHFYHYLNKKHAGLVPGITRVLKEMEKRGRIQAIFNDYAAKITE